VGCLRGRCPGPPAQEQVRRWEGRGKRGEHSVRTYRGLLIYWRWVGQSYRAAADRLRSGQGVDQAGGRSP